MRDQLRQRIMDWHYLDRGDLEDILDDLLPRHYKRYCWSIYHSPDKGKYVLCDDFVNLSNGEVEKAFAAAETHSVDSLYAANFANQVMWICPRAVARAQRRVLDLP